MRLFRFHVVLRKPEPWEFDRSCNGCGSTQVTHVLEMGKRAPDRDTIQPSGFEWIMCDLCTADLRMAVEP